MKLTFVVNFTVELSLLNNTSAAELAGLGGAGLSSSYGGGLNPNSAGSGSGAGYLGGGGSFGAASGLARRDIADSLSAALSSQMSKYDFGAGNVS